MMTRAYWYRKAKFLAIPGLYFWWHLEQDHYDNNRRKFYMCNRKTETAIGQWFYDDVWTEELKLQPNNPKVDLLNDCLQYML